MLPPALDKLALAGATVNTGGLLPLTVNVAVLAKGDTPSTAADATLLAAHVALQADLSLGLGNDVQMGARYEADDEAGDFDYIRVTHRYPVIYRTATGSF